MLYYRPIDLTTDQDFVLEMHCLSLFERDSEWARSIPLQAYRQRWLSTSQPQQFLEQLQASLDDERTLAEVWQEEERPVGFLWLVFSDVAAYGVAVAELNDIVVATSHQRLGIGTMMLQHAEQVARERGAAYLRSETGTDNAASQSIHTKAGFSLYRTRYEKRLQGEPARVTS